MAWLTLLCGVYTRYKINTAKRIQDSLPVSVYLAKRTVRGYVINSRVHHWPSKALQTANSDNRGV